MSKTKGGGSTRNGRDSNAQRLGVKVFDGTAVNAGAELPVTLADARASLELLTALYWSASTGDDVDLPLDDAHPYYGSWLP